MPAPPPAPPPPPPPKPLFANGTAPSPPPPPPPNARPNADHSISSQRSAPLAVNETSSAPSPPASTAPPPKPIVSTTNALAVEASPPPIPPPSPAPPTSQDKASAPSGPPPPPPPPPALATSDPIHSRPPPPPPPPAPRDKATAPSLPLPPKPVAPTPNAQTVDGPPPSPPPSPPPPPPPPPPPVSKEKALASSSVSPQPPPPPQLANGVLSSGASSPPSPEALVSKQENHEAPPEATEPQFTPSAPPLTPTAPPMSPAAPPMSPPPSVDAIARLPIMNRSNTPSSPRRPRRAGTGVPVGNKHMTDYESDLGRSARDEFEQEFLNRNGVTDREGQIINQHLDGVDFRQLSDDEEVLSDDAADPRRGIEAAMAANEQSAELETVDLRTVRQSTVKSNWRRIPSEVGCEGCEGCERLCGENRRLRRQLDELEFELASGVLHNPADGFDPPQVVKAVPAIPQLPVRKKGWASKLRTSTMNGGKVSEKARLRSEVKALTVTTEYLWRKLNKAEIELRNYRLKDLRNRMKMNPEPTSSAGQSLNVASADWEWE